MAQPEAPQSEPPPTTAQRIARKLFGSKRSSLHPAGSHDDDNELAGPGKGSHPRRFKSVVPGLPRQQTLKRQQSESRVHLVPVKTTSDERRAASMDRRSYGFRRSEPIHGGPVLPRPTSSCSYAIPPDAPELYPGHLDDLYDNVADGVDGVDQFHLPPDALSDVHSIAPSHNEVIRHELETRWILNLSMHFKDHSDREKFFVTYRQTDYDWKRITISLDYSNAPNHSLEMTLSQIRYQKDKSARIYEAIRDSLPDIQFYDTVTNLKLETLGDRLHIHVVEDGNEIIEYPSVSQVAHLDCRHIRETDIQFDSHMSGFVYKVNVGNTMLIKKEIPGPDTIQEFLYEVNALNSLMDSDHVIDFYGLVVDEHDEYVKGLLIGYAHHGALIDIIYDLCRDSNQGLGWPLRERWAQQIIQGLADVHESGFVQGDFTLSNIVVDENHDAKLIDINRRGCPVGWEPPEATPLLRSNNRLAMYIGNKSDLYQLGMVLWALAMGVDEPELERERGPLVLGPEVDVPLWYRRVTEICLKPNPKDRLQATLLVDMFPRDHHASADARSILPNYIYEDTHDSLPRDHSMVSGSLYPYIRPPAYESWDEEDFAPRGRSPPSISASSFDQKHPVWASSYYARPGYSDIEVEEEDDDDEEDETGEEYEEDDEDGQAQQDTPTPTADSICLPTTTPDDRSECQEDEAPPDLSAETTVSKDEHQIMRSQNDDIEMENDLAEHSDQVIMETPSSSSEVDEMDDTLRVLESSDSAKIDGLPSETDQAQESATQILIDDTIASVGSNSDKVATPATPTVKSGHASTGSYLTKDAKGIEDEENVTPKPSQPQPAIITLGSPGDSTPRAAGYQMDTSSLLQQIGSSFDDPRLHDDSMLRDNRTLVLDSDLPSACVS
ncbi:unnamed protein product [Clonostachys chloroleuca]|uniref:Protein kinase domain-containing protein n=1 Tax=Clonostachys chloroleuca TaxID=1926264 RepID=A0AA35M459_9HYPO|nr:unnamed protein product [Clonostachys chloroleuca]